MPPSQVFSHDPAIEYFPNLEKHLLRTEKIRAANEKSGRLALPTGFPTQIQSRMTWAGETLEAEEWIVLLTPSHLKEIDEALHHFQS
jgi:hypothetical protein